MANTKSNKKETVKSETEEVSKTTKQLERKKTNWLEDDGKIIRARLNRITGQIKGIINMLDEGRDYEDVLIQLSSSYKSIRSVTNMILCNHLVECVKQSGKGEKFDLLEEVMEIFKRYQ